MARTERNSPTTSRSGRVSPKKFITLLTGLFTDSQEYILTDEDGNAIYVNDSTGFPVASTEWSTRPTI